MSNLIKAQLFAQYIHREQLRKFSNKLYFTHLERVANIVKEELNDEIFQVISYLHDSIEDQEVTKELLSILFDDFVADSVNFLTNKFTTKNFPILNRAERKKRENERLVNELSDELLTIKLADTIDNCEGISNYYCIQNSDIINNFISIYLNEKRNFIYSIYKLNRRVDLWHVAEAVIEEEFIKMG